mmetsp:Transcript_33470/g.61775  ORF Transcript_33470/g.61775 Transcript_33470/m.61775 type:complete len:205 (+) Transcript_33470:705-1319(+)
MLLTIFLRSVAVHGTKRGSCCLVCGISRCIVLRWRRRSARIMSLWWWCLRRGRIKGTGLHDWFRNKIALQIFLDDSLACLFSDLFARHFGIILFGRCGVVLARVLGSITNWWHFGFGVKGRHLTLQLLRQQILGTTFGFSGCLFSQLLLALFHLHEPLFLEPFLAFLFLSCQFALLLHLTTMPFLYLFALLLPVGFRLLLLLLW